MKLRTATALAAILVLAASSTWAGTQVFAGYNWDDQPWAPYASGSVSVDGLGSLVVNSAAGGKTVFLPGVSLTESFSGAKLLESGPFATIHTKVFDGRTTGQHGWAVLLYDDAGNVLDFGARATTGIGWVDARMWDGSALTSTHFHDRNSGDKYYTLDFAQQGDGTININAEEYLVSDGTSSVVNWTTPVAFGNITGIYLTASSSNKTAFSYKYTEFELPTVPEPGSLVAVGCALTGLFGYVVRRRRS